MGHYIPSSIYNLLVGNFFIHESLEMETSASLNYKAILENLP